MRKEEELIEALKKGILPSPFESSLIKTIEGADTSNLERLGKVYPKLVQFLCEYDIIRKNSITLKKL